VGWSSFDSADIYFRDSFVNLAGIVGLHSHDGALDFLLSDLDGLVGLDRAREPDSQM
jgi:hypothetical protein